MVNRIIITVVLLVAMQITIGVYNSARGPIEGQIAVNQLNDSIVDYTIAREIATRGLVVRLIRVFFFIILIGLVWRKTISTMLTNLARRIGNEDKLK